MCVRQDQYARAGVELISLYAFSVFRLALIVVAGWMPRESPSSSRGPPLLVCSPRRAARFRAFHVESCSTTLVQTASAEGWARIRRRCQVELRPNELPLYQPGALVKCFSSRIMTRSARLWPPLSFSRPRRRFLSILRLFPFFFPFPSLGHPARRFRVPRRFPLGGCGFFPPLRLVSFSVSHRYLLPADEDKLCSCLSHSLRRRLGHAKRRPDRARSLSRYRVSRGIRVPVGFSDSLSLAFRFISPPLFRFLYVRLLLSDS